MSSTALNGRLRLDSEGREVWYRSVGTGTETLLALHGGPGSGSDYLESLDTLAGHALNVVRYDQLGGGRSDRPCDASLWTLDRFVSEVETVRQRLELDEIHLFGQSWGGMLALQFALEKPSVVKSLILSNTGASVPLIVQQMNLLRDRTLGQTGAHDMRQMEKARRFEAAEYQRMVKRLYANHVRRSSPFSEERSIAEVETLVLPLIEDAGPSYEVMWGPNEFVCTGNLANWDVSDRLEEIRIPALVICGFFDEITVECHRQLAHGIDRSEFVILGQSSHMLLWEREAELCLDVIRSFLARVVGVEADTS